MGGGGGSWHIIRLMRPNFMSLDFSHYEADSQHKCPNCYMSWRKQLFWTTAPRIPNAALGRGRGYLLCSDPRLCPAWCFPSVPSGSFQPRPAQKGFCHSRWSNPCLIFLPKVSNTIINQMAPFIGLLGYLLPEVAPPPQLCLMVGPTMIPDIESAMCETWLPESRQHSFWSHRMSDDKTSYQFHVDGVDASWYLCKGLLFVYIPVVPIYQWQTVFTGLCSYFAISGWL